MPCSTTPLRQPTIPTRRRRPSAQAPPLNPCNGAPSYCAVTYDQITYPATHAAIAYITPPFVCPAQDLSPRTQLDDGIRALLLEAHAVGSDDAGVEEGGSPDASEAGTGGASLVLCAGDCALGATPIGATLADVAAFLAVNPNEIVTLLVEGGVDAPNLAAAFVAAGLDQVALPRVAVTDPWLTLATMITSRRASRLRVADRRILSISSLIVDSFSM